MTHPLHGVYEISDVSRPDVVVLSNLPFTYLIDPIVNEHSCFNFRKEPLIINVSKLIRNLHQELANMLIDKFSYRVIVFITHIKTLNVRG